MITMDITGNYKTVLLCVVHHQYDVRYFDYQEKLYSIISPVFNKNEFKCYCFNDNNIYILDDMVEVIPIDESTFELYYKPL